VKQSFYFSELSSSYDAEIQDLLSDSEGKSALKSRLQEKRQALAAILPMIDFSPEMVVPVFYDAFSFVNPKVIAAVVQCEPDDGDFPAWHDLAPHLVVEDWARPLLDAVLAEGAGETFMVTAACLEFLRKHESGVAASDSTERDSASETGFDEDADDDDRDLAEAGDDWMAEQGFDSVKS